MVRHGEHLGCEPEPGNDNVSGDSRARSATSRQQFSLKARGAPCDIKAQLRRYPAQIELRARFVLLDRINPLRRTIPACSTKMAAMSAGTQERSTLADIPTPSDLDS